MHEGITGRLGQQLRGMARAHRGRQHPGVSPFGDRSVPQSAPQQFGVTIKDPLSNLYPKPEDRPNTYWVQWVSQWWDLEPDPKQGRKALTQEDLDDKGPIDTSNPPLLPIGKGVVHHYADRGPANGHYVPEGTLLLCFFENERWWFTHSRVTFVAKLGAGELESPANAARWKYPFTEQVKTGEGYDGWTDLPGGRTGYCRNTVEVPNTGTEGIDPATAGAPVECWEEAFVQDGAATVETWFQWENARADSSSDPSNPSQPTEPGQPVDVCVLACGPIDAQGCYQAVERTLHLPPGTTWTDGPTRRLMMCSTSDPSQPSQPSQPSSPSEPGADHCGCLPGTLPPAVLLSVLGIAARGCADCGGLNWDWRLAYSTGCTYILSDGTVCYEGSQAGSDPSGEPVLWRAGFGYVAGNPTVAVWAVLEVGSDYQAVWQTTLFAPQDGANIDVTLPLLLEIGTRCNAAGSTVRVRSAL